MMVSTQQKLCCRCKTAKPLILFTKDRARCLVCETHRTSVRYHSNLPKSRAAGKASRARFVQRYPEKTLEQRRKSTLKNSYGMTLPEYMGRFEQQSGRCAICRGE